MFGISLQKAIVILEMTSQSNFGAALLRQANFTEKQTFRSGDFWSRRRADDGMEFYTLLVCIECTLLHILNISP